MAFALDTEHTFDSGSFADWNSSTDPITDTAVGSAGDGFSVKNDSGTTTAGGTPSTIATGNNHAAGGGGKAYRFGVGNGGTDRSPALLLDWGTPLTEGWFRFYIRFQSGFDWDKVPEGVPNWIKLWDMRTSGILIFGHYARVSPATGRGWGWNVQNSTDWGGSEGWNDTMGDGTNGQLGDGLWHCMEGHWKEETSGGAADGELDVWIDNNLTGSWSNVGVPIGGWSGCTIWENVSSVENGDFTVDIDDIRVSGTARIGPLGAAAPSVAIGNLSLR